MKIRFFTAQSLAKIGFCISKLCTSKLGLCKETIKSNNGAFGKLALKLCPNALEHINCKGSLILVTGSDRSTSADTISNILKVSGKKVIAVAGDNNKNQIAGQLLARCSPFGKIKSEFVLVEARDSSAPEILASLSPDYAVITNLLHTMPEKNGLPEMIKEKIEKSVTKNTLLVLNANDPLLAGLSVSTKCVYFAARDENHNNIVSDEPLFGIRCPKCGSTMDYSKVYTAHIGHYKCTNISCGFCEPDTIYTAANIDYERKRMQIMGYGVGVQINGELTYSRISSICASVTLCNIMGIDMKYATAHASTIKHNEEYESLKFGNRKVKLITVKQDAANFEKAISSITQNAQKKSVIIYLNNKGFQKNISWLYDADVSKLSSNEISVIISGNRAFDVAVRLKLEGIDKGNLKIIDDIENIRKYINILCDEVCIICFVENSSKDKLKLINRMHAQLLA